MSESAGKAVFLSYASQDAEVARRMCESLRGFGLEVWFDQSELRGGDAWDQKIRRQIRDCALFVPVISAHTQHRLEGYFRLEWNLADDRTRLMARGRPFIVPVTTDATTERDAQVPDSFLAVQWTRLPGGEVPPALGARLRALLGPAEIETGRPRHAQRDETVARPQATARRPTIPLGMWAAVLVIALGIGALFALRPVTKETTSARSDSKPETTGSNPSRQPQANPRFLAVLPFVNLSEDRDNTTGFAEGMHDEVIDALGKIAALNVISRTSVLPYSDPKLRNHQKIAAALGIGTVVEGTVRRDGNTVRIVVELVDAQTSRRLWGDTYNCGLTDVFAAQAAIAQEVAARLDAKLTASERTLLARRPTENPRAHELYLQAKPLLNHLTSASPLKDWERATRLLDQAVDADPDFASAYALLARIHIQINAFSALGPSRDRREHLARQALAAAQHLAPTAPETRLAEGHFVYVTENDFAKAFSIYQPLLAELPNDDELIFRIGLVERHLGRHDKGATAIRQALALNPSDANKAQHLMISMLTLRRFREAVEIGGRYEGSSKEYDVVLPHTDTARYELDGDRARLARSRRERVRRDDPNGKRAAYEAALITGDLAEAARVLSQIDQPAFGFNEPIAVHRALLAYLLGQRAVAATHAAEATDYYLRHSARSPLDQVFVPVRLAMLDACVEKGAEARRRAAEVRQVLGGKGGLFDLWALNELGRVYALLGEREEALAILRTLMTGPNSQAIFGTPRLVRIDPCWSRLADDPRFDEILKAAKPL